MCVINLQYVFCNVTARSFVDVFPTTTINGVSSPTVCRNHGSYILTKFWGENKNFYNIARCILQNHLNKSFKLFTCYETAAMGWRMFLETLLTTSFFTVMGMFATWDPYCSWIAVYHPFVFVGNVCSFYCCAYSDMPAELVTLWNVVFSRWDCCIGWLDHAGAWGFCSIIHPNSIIVHEEQIVSQLVTKVLYFMKLEGTLSCS
jgi:hypothetical protein